MCGGTVGEEEGIKILISKAEGFDYRGWHGEIRLVQCYEETVWDLTHMLEGAKINGGDEGGSTSTSREEARNVASDPSGPEL